jgi:signal transduction histidine kinase
MREAAELLEVLAEEKSQLLKVEGDERAIVEGDRLILRQAFVNVLHNAVKFSPVGGTILLRAQVDGANVIVTIEDSGPGVPVEHADRIFDRFYRVDPSRSRDGGGAGLGLAIAKWAVEVHRGTVTVVKRSNSEIASGAVFRIELPLNVPKPLLIGQQIAPSGGL